MKLSPGQKPLLVHHELLELVRASQAMRKEVGGS